MNITQLNDIRRDILTLDLLCDTYTRKQFSYPFTDFVTQRLAFESFKEKVTKRYQTGLIELRQFLYKNGVTFGCNRSWQYIGRTFSNLFVWQGVCPESKQAIYQVTFNELMPSAGCGYYYSLQTLLKYKNTRINTEAK